jgi:hypothetical protein
MSELWLKQRDIVKECLEKYFFEKFGERCTIKTMTKRLGVGKHRPEGWFRAKSPVPPNAEELKMLGDLLDIPANWLLYGKGAFKGVAFPAEDVSKPEKLDSDKSLSVVEKLLVVIRNGGVLSKVIVDNINSVYDAMKDK